MNNPFDFFDKIYCVNLPEHTERKQLVSKEFEKVNILDRVEWTSAPKPPSDFKIDLYRRNPAAEFGCSLSHLKAVVNSIDAQNKMVLFTEDDIVFIDKSKEILTTALQQLPNDWVGLYLGCVPVNKKKISSNLVKISGNNTWGTWAYCLRGEYLLDFFEYWINSITHPVAGKLYSPVDAILSSYLSNKNGGYAVYPPIAVPNELASSSISGNNNTLLIGHKKHWSNI